MDEPASGERAHPHLSLRGAAACALPRGRSVEIEPKDALMLAFLAIQGQTARATLAERLWPDVEAERARGNLRARLLRMKQRLGADLLAPGTHVTLAAGVTHDLDDESDVLAPLALEEAGGFADWLEAQRATRKARRADKLAATAADAEARGQIAAALDAAQALIALDPLSEHAHRRVMRLHYLRGDRAAAQAAYHRCADVLRRELGARPSAETEALLQQIDSAVAPQATRAPLPVTVLRPPRLVGRDNEMAAVAQAWRDGQLVLVLGEAGMGKSRLLAEFTDTTTVAAAARPGDATVPFAVAARFLRTLIAQVPAAAPPASRAQLAALLPEYAERETGPAGNLAKLANVLLDVLKAAQAEGVRAVLLDDLHFADDATLDLLRELVADPALTLRWAFAQRPAEATAAARGFADALGSARRLASVDLAPLDVDAMAALVDSLGVPLLDGAKVAAALVRHTGGNPLFALETIKAMLVGGGVPKAGSAAQLPAPTSVGALIGQRLKQLSPRAVALARLGAVAGPDFSANLAERILGTSALELADAWAELEAAQVLRDAAFAHDLVYEVTLAGVPAAIARELHARVADELESRGAPPERIAAHRVAAADARKSIPALQAAAAAARAKFQRPLATDLLEQAAALLEQIGERDRAFDVLAEAVQMRQSFDTGARHDDASRRLLDLAATPLQRAEALVHRGSFLHITARSAEALPLLLQARHAAEAAGDTTAVHRAMNVQGNVLRRLGRVDEAVAVLREALALNRVGDGNEDLPAVLNNLALAELEADDAVGAILHFEEAARLQGDTLTRARVLNNLAIALEEIGNVERALDTRLIAQRLLRGQEGTDVAQLNLLVSLASCARHLQRFGEALGWMDQLEAIAATSRHWRVDNARVHRAHLWIDLGSWRAADETLQALEARCEPDTPEHASVLVARAQYNLARNLDATAVLAKAEKVLARFQERRMVRRFLALKVRALPPPEARRLAEAELDREAARGNRASQIPFATLAARACLAEGDVQAALRLAQRAADALKTVQAIAFSPFEVRYVLCEALAAVGDDSAAAEIVKLGADLQQLAATHVPEAHRGTFLQGVALHRNIKAAADKAAAAGRIRLLKR